MKVTVGGAGQPSRCQAVTLWDTLPSQDPQTGPRGLLPRVHCPSRGHIPAGGDNGGCRGPGLTPHASGTAWTPHPICGRASPKSSPSHPMGPPAWGTRLLPFVPWRLGVPAVGRGPCGGVAPPSPLALLTARAVQKALGSAISHAASEHAARLFPGEQRRQLLPSCSTSLPHLLAPSTGEGEAEKPPPPALAPLPPAEKAHPRVGSGGRYNVEGGTTRNAAVGQCWLVGGWIGPIPALSSTSRSLSSQDHPPSSPQPGTDPAVPLSASRRAGPRAAPSGVSAAPGGLPGSPPQCPLAGRGSGDPRPSSSLLSQRCGQVAASPHLPPPRSPYPPYSVLPGGLGHRCEQ